MPTLGENIQRFRKMRGFTQTELADWLRVSQQTVCRYEADESEPDMYMIYLIARGLSVSPYEILKGVFENYYRESDKRIRAGLPWRLEKRGD